MSSTEAPTVADIDRITGISNPVVRNLQITQCYAELSAVMALRTGPSELVHLCHLGLQAGRMDAAMDRFVARVRSLAHLVITEHMMTIGLPEGKYLRLGRDLRADYPPSLVRLANEDLLGLLAQVDPTTDSIVATGALDWGRLTDRLHFIVDMFRCYQEWPLLFDSPFTAEQTDAIKRGQRPQGEL